MHKSSKIIRLLWIATAVCFCPTDLSAEEVDSFLEPYRRVAIPSSDMGVIAQMFVVEGDHVTTGQQLAELDNTVLAATLEVARAAKDSTGAIEGARAELQIKNDQLAGYQRLRSKDNASQRELDRAIGEHSKAQSRLMAISEDLEVRRLEYEQAKARLIQRRITSPIDGYVVAIAKEAGEFVSPTDPVIMHIVQLSELKAVFSVPMDRANRFQSGQQVTLSIGEASESCGGVIEFVSPIADAQSGSVRIKIRVRNQQGELQSGAACRWDLSQEPKPADLPIRRAGSPSSSHFPDRR